MKKVEPRVYDLWTIDNPEQEFVVDVRTMWNIWSHGFRECMKDFNKMKLSCKFEGMSIEEYNKGLKCKK